MLLAAIIPTKTGVLTSCRAISDAPFAQQTENKRNRSHHDGTEPHFCSKDRRVLDA
jgi:hypothetical protein